jgi:phosphoribosylformylglycinamidine cyclo-ligase
MSASKESTESAAYAALGASSAKGGVLKAVGEHATSRYFASPIVDPFGDATKSFFLHADGAGTKSIVAYLLYRETGDVKWFRSLATDSLVMNLDDIACSGALSGLVLSNTIGRNRRLVPDEAIAEIIAGYKECAATLASFGIEITLSGGETADMGDLVRTLVVDSTLSARIPSTELVDAYRVQPGDAIVAFSNVGQVAWESAPNSGMGSNGLSLARNVLLSRYHVESYPEVGDPEIAADVAYRGPYKVLDEVAELGTSVGAALLSPTRSYAPLIKAALRELRTGIHSLIHCTGGGQVKIKRFGRGVRFEKNNLFPTPPLFELIQKHGAIPWPEMYSVFNMGHRLEACVDPAAAPEIIGIAAQFGIAGRVIGQVSSTSGDNEVVITSPHGEFTY